MADLLHHGTAVGAGRPGDHDPLLDDPRGSVRASLLKKGKAVRAKQQSAEPRGNSVQLSPSLTPDPRTHLGASASIFAVDDGVTLGSFLERRRAIVSEEEYAKEKQAYIRQASAAAGGGDGTTILTLPGENVFVNATIQGFKSRSVAMLASMYDADRRMRELSDVPVFQQHVDAPSDQSVVEFWLSAPPVKVERYFVRVQVYHRGDGVLLGIADSRPIVAR